MFKDLYGFDELEKAFKRCEQRYPNQADALLMAAGSNVNKMVKSRTPVRTKKLRNSWRLKKVKLYRGGTVRVVRIQSSANHSHLIEYGHEIVRGGRTRKGGRKLNRVQRSVRGISSHGRTKAVKMLESSMADARNSFRKNVDKMLDKLTNDIKI